MPATPKTFQQTLQELWELLKAYAQQETVGPLKSLGRRIGFGLAGSLCLAFGVLFLVLGLMRGLQSHTLPDPVGTFFQIHDWIVYLIAVALLGGICALCIQQAKKKPLPERSAELAEEPT